MIAYASRTGNVRYIVSRLGLPAAEIGADVTLEEPFLLITYTDGIGEIPHQVKQFLESNGAYCRGVIVSGNSNFGHHVFGGAGDAISQQWQIPLVRKVEMRGFPEDYEAIHQYYERCFREERVR
ncbi:class Ib ribonucleoside-diphosphate reductase assembly flavoprotein NrdI [Paenibacillus aurantius]|uniref:Class Ib ribonucleoside-diphosphate reductase assembly flavoprotein NrdI n=1 Tax=Paenibacillus aurantius TaxID=2918900 RepID=A0AA96L9M8_9BACL|nr:class Ib ribonucleoside-diphosphate reductase assembly flavoprotein NrdI [Paenibacillus aurantius]WNQ09576.1 class Ib ribonucleoside-diphosphate reductase assembly flavoprotein NrdI [Paenibacillus aurantius]